MVRISQQIPVKIGYNDANKNSVHSYINACFEFFERVKLSTF